MRDYMDIGPSPYDEDCVQFNPSDGSFREPMLKECYRYKNLLESYFFYTPAGCRVRVKEHVYPPSSYYSVCVDFNDSIEEELDYALLLEGSSPPNWEWSVEKQYRHFLRWLAGRVMGNAGTSGDHVLKLLQRELDNIEIPTLNGVALFSVNLPESIDVPSGQTIDSDYLEHEILPKYITVDQPGLKLTVKDGDSPICKA